MFSSSPSLYSEKQPRALYILILVQMWESFSFFGMRVLLVLFLIDQWHFQEAEAFGLYALYTGLVEVGALAGGFCGDRFLGPRHSTYLGCMGIMTGHLCLFFGQEFRALFMMGLGSISVGSALFRSNIKGILANCYGTEDSRREEGFTLYYAGINTGGFLAAVLCGIVAQTFGWHYGFGLASLGMLAGVATLFGGRASLPLCLKEAPSFPTFIVGFIGIALAAGAATYMLHHQGSFHPYVAFSAFFIFVAYLISLKKWLSFSRLLHLAGVLILLIFFFICEEWMGSLLMVFTEKHIHRTIGNFEIPSAALSAINPLTIMLMGRVVAKRTKKACQGLMAKLSPSFFCLGGAFILLYGSTLQSPSSCGWIAGSYALIALGELYLVPLVFAFCSDLAPPNHQSSLMGLVILSMAMACLLSGKWSQHLAQGGIEMFSPLFLSMAVISFLLAIGLQTLSKRL